jgi:hypothetical protein
MGIAKDSLLMDVCYRRTFLGTVKELNSWPLDCAAVDVTLTALYLAVLRVALRYQFNSLLLRAKGYSLTPQPHRPKVCIQLYQRMQLVPYFLHKVVNGE